MSFKYSIKGIELNMHDMCEISEFFEAHCTAEYLMYNYGFSEPEAVRIGYLVRAEMANYNVSEDDAIYSVLKREEARHADHHH